MEPRAEGSTISGAPIVVHEQPMVFWDSESYKHQIQFLESLDPSYFLYIAKMNLGELEGDNSNHAAIAIKTNYSQCLEALFSMTAAAIQAPLCPAGWMLKYRNIDLRAFIAKLSNYESGINAYGTNIHKWEEVAEVLHPWHAEGIDRDQFVTAAERGFSALANELVDTVNDQEYNSLKHGLRARSSPWFLSMGLEDIPGIAAPPDRMRTIASSSYGTSFLSPIKLKPNQWTFTTQRSNWTPQALHARTSLAVQLMHNVITFLKILNGMDPDKLGILQLTEEDVSALLSERGVSDGTRFSMGPGIAQEMIQDLSRDQILEWYKGIRLVIPEQEADPLYDE